MGFRFRQNHPNGDGIQVSLEVFFIGEIQGKGSCLEVVLEKRADI